MPKSNAERQREWRARQREKKRLERILEEPKESIPQEDTVDEYKHDPRCDYLDERGHYEYECTLCGKNVACKCHYIKHLLNEHGITKEWNEVI